MEHKRRKGLLALALAMFVAVLGLIAVPGAAWADGDVAQIGAEAYASLDEAIAAADDDGTIELLADATTAGINLHKDLTIQAADGLSTKPTITFTQYGIGMASGDSEGCSLTFKDVDISMTDIGSTPATGEWNWLSICVSKSTLTLDNVTMTMDGGNAVGANNKTVHAIYFTGNSELNLMNGSVLTIKNYDEDALEWDSGNTSYKVNITDSTYISDNNRSGFTGTFYATIDNSTVKVLNSAGNGSNGTYYTIKNGSEVTFDNSGTWGISAYRIDMTNDSKLIATNNGYSGVWTRILNVDSSCMLDVEKNGYSGSFTGVPAAVAGASNAGISFYGNSSTASVIEDGANVTVTGNAGSGIATLQGVANLTIGSASITDNGTGDENGDHCAVYGGGLYNIGTVYLGSDVALYNNHASGAGDDIYFAPTSTARTLTFGATGSEWSLDGTGIGGSEDECDHAIDGWYDDSVETTVIDPDTGDEVIDPETNEVITVGGRWNARIFGDLCSKDTARKHHVEEVVDYAEDGSIMPVTGSDLADADGNLGTLALKAAHGDKIKLELTGVKTLDGRTLEDGEFSFTLTGVDEDGENAPLPEAITVSNDADGNFAFDELTYDSSEIGKTYTYTVSEVTPEDDDPNTGGVQNGNVTYDTEPVTVIVRVRVVKGELTLVKFAEDAESDADEYVPGTYYEKAGEEVEGISFTNVYAEPAAEEPEEPTTPEEPVTPDDGGDDATVDDGGNTTVDDGKDDATTDAGSDDDATTGDNLLQTGDPVSIAAVAVAAAAGLGTIGAGALVGKRRK